MKLYTENIWNQQTIRISKFNKINLQTQQLVLYNRKKQPENRTESKIPFTTLTGAINS